MTRGDWALFLAALGMGLAFGCYVGRWHRRRGFAAASAAALLLIGAALVLDLAGAK